MKRSHLAQCIATIALDAKQSTEVIWARLLSRSANWHVDQWTEIGAAYEAVI